MLALQIDQLAVVAIIECSRTWCLSFLPNLSTRYRAAACRNQKRRSRYRNAWQSTSKRPGNGIASFLVPVFDRALAIERVVALPLRQVVAIVLPLLHLQFDVAVNDLVTEASAQDFALFC